MTQRIEIVEQILGANDEVAAANRRLLDDAGVFGMNILASPGAGKTSLVEHTVRGLSSRVRLAVIDGDIATSIDADRAAAAGAVALQINTGGECHLDAPMISKALPALNLHEVDALIVENVGNLICPANFPLGMHQRVLVASIPEGADKPYKYPGTYRGVDVLVINKIDLLPYIDFDMDYFRRGVEILNPGLRTFSISCRTGEGLEAWLAWVEAQVAARSEAHLAAQPPVA